MLLTDPLTLGAFALGIAFGMTGQLSGFCLLSGLRRRWLEGNSGMIAAYAVAIAVAVSGLAALTVAGVVDSAESIYRGQNLSLPVIAVGGALFGYGMVLANGCGARALVLLGRGNLRSFVVLACLVFGAQIAMKGVLAPARLAAQQASAGPSGGASLADWLAGLLPNPALATAMTAALLALVCLVFAWRVASRRDWKTIAGGAIVGALIVAGWVVTGVLGADDFEPAPLASLSFVAPTADTAFALMLSTGGISRGIAVPLVIGVPIGAFLAAAWRGRLAFEAFTAPRRMLYSMAGGLLMGIGGVMALGCTIGQGLTGMSTLAVGSMLALAAIVAGAWLGLVGPLRLRLG